MNESQSVGINPSKIMMHEDWKPFNYSKYHADIAMIWLETEVTFTKFIYPACLPSVSLQKFSGVGTIAGWGKYDSSATVITSDIPRYVEIRTEDSAFCYTNDSDVALMSSHLAFCAGGKGAGPCR